MESQMLAILPDTTREHSDSTARLIREWLFRFGVEHNVDVAPRLPLWLEAFYGMEPSTLERLFRQAIRTCKFFPKVSDVLQPIEDSPVAQAEAELRWNRVLDFVRIYWSPDLPGGISRGAPRITERTMTAIRAAGGLAWIAECPRDELQWARKRFLESYTAWDTLKRDEYLLPEDSPIRALLSGVCKALPGPRPSFALLHERGMADSDSLNDLPDVAPEVAAERYTELARQAKELIAKFPRKGQESAS